MSSTLAKRRAGQLAFEDGVEAHRVFGFVARRQYGKTTSAARIAVKKMIAKRNHTVIFGSGKLSLGSEIIYKESGLLRGEIRDIQKELGSKVRLVDDAGRDTNSLKADDFAEVFESNKLELRIYHSTTSYSRTKVVALTINTVGETGDLIADEIRALRNFREIWEAISPIISSNPNYRCILTTTPPTDDTHYAFELLAPPAGVKLPVNPAGNLYQSDAGIWVLQVTADDAYADGVPLYDDDTGEPLDPETARQRAHDKDAFDRNYRCKWLVGGTAACGMMMLDTAQARGVDKCQFFQVYEDSDLDAAVEWIAANIGPGRVGLGWDLATTTEEKSNPSAFTVLEQNGAEEIARAILVWKSADPDEQLERARRIVQAVRANGHAPAVGLGIDGTNERLFAARVAKELRAELPVEVIIASETVEVSGQEKPMTLKQYMGGGLVGDLDDNKLTLPAARYVRDDWRLVRKEKGLLDNVVDTDGKHADTFDSTKDARHILIRFGGAVYAVAVSVGGDASQPRRVINNPFAGHLDRPERPKIWT